MKMTIRYLTIILILVLLSVLPGLFVEPGTSLKSFTYILQADEFADSRSEAVKKLASSDRDLLIIDYSFSGSENE